MASNENVIGYVFHESAPSVQYDIKNVQEVRKGVVRFETVLQEAELPNRNFRKYKKGVIAKGLEGPRIQEKIKTNSLLGEEGHPDASLPVSRQFDVVKSNASHLIREYYWDTKDPNLLMGKIETAATTVGRDFAGLILENGMIPSFSMRGSGDVIKESNGMMVVKDPLTIITYDNVHFPSHQKAYMSKIINESVKDESFAITDKMIAKYAAEHSKNVKQLNEEFFMFDLSKSEFLIENNTIKIISGGKLKGAINMEAKLNNEVQSIYRDMFGRM